MLIRHVANVNSVVVTYRRAIAEQYISDLYSSSPHFQAVTNGELASLKPGHKFVSIRYR